MRTQYGDKRDPVENQIERALCPGEFIRDRSCFSFVNDLEQVAKGIKELIATEPGRAVALYEAFLAGCYAKVEQLDDSSGNFGLFVKELICLWIKARQADGADPDETAGTLLRWMDDDPYAFCYEIEKDTSAAFDAVGRAAFEKQVRARFESLSHDPESWPYRRLSAVLRAIFLSQENISAYVEHAKRTGLTPQDCLAIAKLVAARAAPEALAWVERGLAMDMEKRCPSAAGYDLEQLHRELLVQLGRGIEAFQAAWESFRKHPSEYSYRDLMKFVPECERAAWHEEAMEAARSADLHSLISLLVGAKENDRLAELVRRVTDQELEEVSHYVTEPAAVVLEEAHPGSAARLWRAQAIRIVDAKKSKYYDVALANFERARVCYLRADLAAEWDQTARQVCAAHFRKSGFIGEFQRLAAGAKRTERPSFLETAKQRWGKKQEG